MGESVNARVMLRAAVAIAVCAGTIGFSSPAMGEGPAGAPPLVKSAEPASVSTHRPSADRLADDCYRSPIQDAADPCAQWRSAIAAEQAVAEAGKANWLEAGAILVGAATFLVTLFGLLRSLRQTAKALKVSQASNAIAIESRRPWLKVTVNPKLFFIPGSEGSLHQVELGVEAKNYGNSPAAFAQVHVRLFAAKSLQIDTLFDRLADQISNAGRVGATIYPGELAPLEKRMRHGVDGARWDAVEGQHSADALTAHYLSVAVSYLSPETGGLYYAIEVFEFMRGGNLRDHPADVFMSHLYGPHHGRKERTLPSGK